MWKRTTPNVGGISSISISFSGAVKPPTSRASRRIPMRAALYARVSTTRQTQTIDQQLTRLLAHVERQGWPLKEQHIYRDDGYSGASLTRPGLDALRDRVALAEVDLLLVTAPDRLARNYVHQVLRLEEFQWRSS